MVMVVLLLFKLINVLSALIPEAFSHDSPACSEGLYRWRRFSHGNGEWT